MSGRCGVGEPALEILGKLDGTVGLLRAGWNWKVGLWSCGPVLLWACGVGLWCACGPAGTGGPVLWASWKAPPCSPDQLAGARQVPK